MKRFLSLVLVAMLLVATMAVSMTASAAEITDEATGAGVIKFNASKWNNVKSVYAHIWVNAGDSFYPWGKSDNTACENVQGPIWQYDLSKLSNSTEISGGIKAGTDYCVIFYADTGVQTYDLTFGSDCIGDTAVMTGNMVENPVDSEKEGYEATWTQNKSKYGPHRAITSIGNFVGQKLCPNESPVTVLGDWIITYPATSQYCKPDEILAKAMKEFKVTDITTIYAYVSQKEDIGLANLDEVNSYLEKAYKIAYGEDKKVDKEVATQKAEAISKGEDLDNVSDDKGGSGNKTNSGTTNDASENDTNTTGGTGSNSGSSYSGSVNGSSSGSTDNSGSAADGENDVILFILAGVMLLAAGVFVTTRRRED